ncbi:MAG: LytR family transcriptional regulator, partial [Actinophytocola sp.]|nr:LytR family transcriptional regulator [Actinophytocola sp.]
MLAIIVLAASGYASIAVDNLRAGVSTTPALDEVPDTPPDDGAVDILLIGTDARTDAGGNPLPAAMLKELRTEHKAGIATDT